LAAADYRETGREFVIAAGRPAISTQMEFLNRDCHTGGAALSRDHNAAANADPNPGRADERASGVEGLPSIANARPVGRQRVDRPPADIFLPGALSIAGS